MESVRTYVEGGGPVHVADTLGDTSLLVAASTGNVDLIKVLIVTRSSSLFLHLFACRVGPQSFRTAQF